MTTPGQGGEDRRQHQHHSAPSRPFPAPRSQAITPPAPHAVPPLEPQAQRTLASGRADRARPAVTGMLGNSPRPGRRPGTREVRRERRRLPMLRARFLAGRRHAQVQEAGGHTVAKDGAVEEPASPRTVGPPDRRRPQPQVGLDRAAGDAERLHSPGCRTRSRFAPTAATSRDRRPASARRRRGAACRGGRSPRTGVRRCRGSRRSP